LFLSFLHTNGNILKNLSWPIHSESDKNIAIDIVEKFYGFYLDKLDTSVEEDLKKELYQQKRKTQFVLSARFMNLPENKKITNYAEVDK